MPVQLGYSISRTNGQWQFRITGAASQGYVLQATTNLENWLPLYTNTTSTGPVDFVDRQATNYPWRLYRARPWP
jgi:hypothetical protein